MRFVATSAASTHLSHSSGKFLLPVFRNAIVLSTPIFPSEEDGRDSNAPSGGDIHHGHVCIPWRLCATILGRAMPVRATHGPRSSRRNPSRRVSEARRFLSVFSFPQQQSQQRLDLDANRAGGPCLPRRVCVDIDSLSHTLPHSHTATPHFLLSCRAIVLSVTALGSTTPLTSVCPGVSYTLTVREAITHRYTGIPGTGNIGHTGSHEG